MGCNNTTEYSKCPTENLILKILNMNMKLSNYSLDDFLILLRKKMINKENYFSLVNKHFLYDENVNKYRDAQLIMVLDFSFEPEFLFVVIAWAYVFLLKSNFSIANDLIKILKLSNGIDSDIDIFKKFLHYYLFFNIVYYSNKLKFAYDSGLIDKANDIDFFNLQKCIANNVVFKKEYNLVVAYMEEVLSKKTDNLGERIPLVDLKLDENDIQIIVNKFSYLWEFFSFRRYIFEKYYKMPEEKKKISYTVVRHNSISTDNKQELEIEYQFNKPNKENGKEIETQNVKEK